jgi:hypothetical protein
MEKGFNSGFLRMKMNYKNVNKHTAILSISRSLCQNENAIKKLGLRYVAARTSSKATY